MCFQKKNEFVTEIMEFDELFEKSIVIKKLPLTKNYLLILFVAEIQFMGTLFPCSNLPDFAHSKC